MHILTTTLHVFAGIIWAAGLLAAGSDHHRRGLPARWSGPILLASGGLLAFGSIRHDPSKSLLGLYGLSLLAAVMLFSAMIALARRSSTKPEEPNLWWLLAGTAALSALMVWMAHWPD